MAQSVKRSKKYLLFILVLLGLMLTVELSQVYGLRSAYRQMHQQSAHQLSNLVSYIENTLGRFEKVPEVLSKHWIKLISLLL